MNCTPGGETCRKLPIEGTTSVKHAILGRKHLVPFAPPEDLLQSKQLGQDGLNLHLRASLDVVETDAIYAPRILQVRTLSGWAGGHPRDYRRALLHGNGHTIGTCLVDKRRINLHVHGEDEAADVSLRNILRQLA